MYDALRGADVAETDVPLALTDVSMQYTLPSFMSGPTMGAAWIVSPSVVLKATCRFPFERNIQ